MFAPCTSMPPTTEEIQLLRELVRRESRRYVEWAVLLLQGGQNAESVSLLAGESLSATWDDFRLVDQVLRDIDADAPIDLSEAVRRYAATVVRRLADERAERSENLRCLQRLHVELGMDTVLSDYYYLSFAVDDLDRFGDQHYWPGATCENIDQVIRDVAREWLEIHARDQRG